jgi:hypothetical protein
MTNNNKVLEAWFREVDELVGGCAVDVFYMDGIAHRPEALKLRLDAETEKIRKQVNK